MKKDDSKIIHFTFEERLKLEKLFIVQAFVKGFNSNKRLTNRHGKIISVKPNEKIN